MMPTNTAAKTLPRFCVGICLHPFFDSLPWRIAGGVAPQTPHQGAFAPWTPVFGKNGCVEDEIKVEKTTFQNKIVVEPWDLAS